MKNSEDLTTVTYNFADGTKVVQPITNQSLLSEKKGNKSTNEMHNMFQTTAWDKGALSYSLEGIEESTPVEKELPSTRKEVKNAKRDLKEMKQHNPKGFANSLNQFRVMVADKFANNQRRLRFDLKGIQSLN